MSVGGGKILVNNKNSTIGSSSSSITTSTTSTTTTTTLSLSMMENKQLSPTTTINNYSTIIQHNDNNIPPLIISSTTQYGSPSLSPTITPLQQETINNNKFYVKSHRSKKGIFGKRNSSVKYANSVVSMRTSDDDRRITIHGNLIINGIEDCSNTWMASDLPNEILIKIFTYLNGISFYRVCLVCKSWYRVCEDEILWEQVCILNYPSETQKMQKSNNRRNKITKFKNIYSEIVHNDFILLKTGLFENKNIKFKKSPWSKEDYIFFHSATTSNSGNITSTTQYGTEENVLSISPSAAHGTVINQSMPVKIVVVGDGAVGKTSLLGRFANDEFLSDQYLPTIFDNFTTYSTFENRTWAVTIIDTAGSEDYDKIRPLSYTGCDLFICCFDLMNTSSFQNITNIWIKELNSCAPNVPILLCGTKLDLRISNINESGSLKNYIDSKFSKYGVVTFDEGVALVSKINNCVGYIETSAKSGQGVKKCIETAISYSCKYSLSQLVRYMSRSPTTTGSPNSDNGTTINKRNSNCIIE